VTKSLGVTSSYGNRRLPGLNTPRLVQGSKRTKRSTWINGKTRSGKALVATGSMTQVAYGHQARRVAPTQFRGMPGQCTTTVLSTTLEHQDCAIVIRQQQLYEWILVGHRCPTDRETMVRRGWAAKRQPEGLQQHQRWRRARGSMYVHRLTHSSMY